MADGESHSELKDAYAALSEKRFADARRLFEEASAGGNKEADVYLGYMMANGLNFGRDLAAAENRYKKAYDSGSVRAGLYYAEALRDRHDDMQAAAIYRTLSDRGSASAMYWEYLLYRKELGARADPVKATALLQRAADAGHFFALRELSWRYIKGEFGLSRIPEGVAMAVRGIRALVTAKRHDTIDDRLY